MTDFVTVLATYGPTLTKTYKADGTTESYGDAKSFAFSEQPVSDIHSLSRLLTKLESNPQRCIVRGKFAGEDKAEKGKLEGSWSRTNNSFDDCQHNWLMIDIDNYKPGFADPINEPAAAVMDFLEEFLPPCFKDVSFHWQLSSSAGAPGKEGLLKAHVWFWLDVSYSSAQLYAWAKQYPRIDKAVFRRVQVHYCANPIFEEGVTDPVPVRSGFHQAKSDAVKLIISQELIEQAHTTGSGTSGNDMKLVDPSEKEGLIGLFHEVYSVEDVLYTILEGEFEEGSNERRVTWVNGGGTPEGVWVHDDRMHVHAVHNTWPCDGIVNLWDLVRIFKFGELDHSDDDFEQMDIESRQVGHRPSDIAMLAWANEQPAIRDYANQQRRQRVDALKAEIAGCLAIEDLDTRVAQLIRATDQLSPVDREQLVVAFQARAKDISGVKLPVAEVRRMLAYQSEQRTSPVAPDWAQDWVWDCESDCFVSKSTKQFITERSFNAKFDREMWEFATEEDAKAPKASEFALITWRLEVVDRSIYMPGREVTFEMDGIRCVNLYRDCISGSIAQAIGPNTRRAAKILMEHAEMLIPDKRERELFLDYLAYCVQNPGAKIRWAPLIKGVEGDGKSAFVILMSHLMGHQNVRVLDSATLEKSDFSGWGAGQCFTGVEEVKLHGHNRYDVYNKLKPYISNDFIEVHKKGKDPYNVPNTTNYLLLSNYEDAVPVTDNDRRVMFLRSPFNTQEELFAAIRARFGLEPGEYFDRLFDQCIKPHASGLLKWFMERELSPEFKADGRAPVTSARQLVVDLSVRDDESAVQAALEEGGLGVYPALVSTFHLTTLIRNQYEMELRTSRVSSVLAQLGYRPYGGQVKWRGRPCRFYYRGERPEGHLQELLEAMEADREAAQVETDFRD